MGGRVRAAVACATPPGPIHRELAGGYIPAGHPGCNNLLRERFGDESRNWQPAREHLLFNKCSQLFKSNRRRLPAGAIVEIAKLIPRAAPALISEPALLARVGQKLLIDQLSMSGSELRRRLMAN